MFRKNILFPFFVFFNLIVGGHAWSAEIKFNSVRLGQLSAFQSDGNYFSGVLLWTPSYPLAENLWVGLDLGGSLLSIHDHDPFLATEYILKGIYDLNPRFSLEAGFGAQTWTNNGETFLEFVANGTYHLEKNYLMGIDQIWLGYAYVNSSVLVTHELRMGIGLNF